MASSVDAKLLRATKFPPEFNQKVDMQKVNLQVMKKWIASKISEILGSEDDVVTELCFNLIEGSRYPDIKSMQIQLTGFLDKDTAPFCKDLWNLCLSAQSNPQGVPKELLEAKKLELIQEKSRELDVRLKSVVIASYQTYEIENAENAASVVGAVTTGAAVGDAVVIELLAAVAVVEVDKSSDVVALPPVLLVPTRETLRLVLAHLVRLATVVDERAFDHPPHHVAALEGADPHPATGTQQSEIVLQGGHETTGVVEMTAGETVPLQTVLSLKVSSTSRFSTSKSVKVVILFEITLRRSPTRSPTPSESPEDTRRPRRKSPRRSREDSRSRDVPSRKRRYSANSPRTRDRSADVSEDEDRPQSPRHHAASTADETKTPQQRANELREKLLKERIKKMRSTTSRDNVKG
ncbi:hypothetical protein K449DRAFT_463624 [Hypoxylon sp. EC38]|nr:hypothetical protein K449DRAFT_463624 [Hypoxylon sp. EC38]